MTRLVAEHFKLNGKPKRSYSHNKAKEAARRHYKRPYKCSFCGAWHIGS